jgi:hypothetical protein
LLNVKLMNCWLLIGTEQYRDAWTLLQQLQPIIDFTDYSLSMIFYECKQQCELHFGDYNGALRTSKQQLKIAKVYIAQ